MKSVGLPRAMTDCTMDCIHSNSGPSLNARKLTLRRRTLVTIPKRGGCPRIPLRLKPARVEAVARPQLSEMKLQKNYTSAFQVLYVGCPLAPR
jgi:hypothetical protein